MSTPSGYTLSSYGDMVRCEPRMSAYARALRDAIKPGCTVIDLGAGPGFFSILACRYGAAKVIAIEPDQSIELLRQIARDNGFSDRIDIIRGTSVDYHPSAKADVIVSDLRGGVPYFEGHIGTIRDARERLLAPGGTMIPGRDELFIAAVESSETYRTYDQPWRTNAHGVDFSAGHRFVVNGQRRVELKPDTLLGPSQSLATLDYRTIVEPNLRETARLPITRAGSVHGLLMWFDTELAPGAAYSNAPGQPVQVYRQTFFPLERPIEAEAGDFLHANISANLIDGAYVWSWNTRLLRDGADHGPGLRQSTFLANMFLPKKLATRSAQFVPVRQDAIAIDALCLSLIDGERSLLAIAECVEAQFPRAFASSSDALDRVTRIAVRYGERE